MIFHILTLLSCALSVQAVPVTLPAARHPTPGTNQPRPNSNHQRLHRSLQTTEDLRVLKIGGSEQNGSTSVSPTQPPVQYPQPPVQYPQPPVQYPQPPTSPQWPQGSAMSGEVFTAVLPRQLNSGDKVTIGGKVSDNASQFTVLLAAGAYSIDQNNIAFRFQVDFSSNRVVLSTVHDGVYETVGEESITFSPGSDWGLDLEIHRNEIIVLVDDTYHSQLDLKHNIESIRFIQTSGHVDHVKTLAFRFAEPNKIS